MLPRSNLCVRTHAHIKILTDQPYTPTNSEEAVQYLPLLVVERSMLAIIFPSIGDRDCVSHAPRCQQSWQGTQLHAGLMVNSKVGLTSVCVLGECSFLSNLELQALAACMWLGFLSHNEVLKRLLLLPIPIYHSGI